MNAFVLMTTITTIASIYFGVHLPGRCNPGLTHLISSWQGANTRTLLTYPGVTVIIRQCNETRYLVSQIWYWILTWNSDWFGSSEWFKDIDIKYCGKAFKRAVKEWYKCSFLVLHPNGPRRRGAAFSPSVEFCWGRALRCALVSFFSGSHDVGRFDGAPPIITCSLVQLARQLRPITDCFRPVSVKTKCWIWQEAGSSVWVYFPSA